MDDPVRFHLDEHMDSAIARALMAAGIDVSTTVGSRLLSADDDLQWSRALSERRMIVTDDVDFLSMAARGQKHFGIVFCRRSIRTLGQILNTLIWLHTNFTAAEMVDRVIHVMKEVPDARRG